MNLVHCRLVILFISVLGFTIWAQDQNKSSIKKMVFEEKRIEGKIRRPQLVLIKADQRPEFSPMVLQGFGKLDNIVRSVDESIIDKSPYNEPFQFNDMKVTNYTP